MEIVRSRCDVREESLRFLTESLRCPYDSCRMLGVCSSFVYYQTCTTSKSASWLPRKEKASGPKRHTQITKHCCRWCFRLTGDSLNLHRKHADTFCFFNLLRRSLAIVMIGEKAQHCRLLKPYGKMQPYPIKNAQKRSDVTARPSQGFRTAPVRCYLRRVYGILPYDF